MVTFETYYYSITSITTFFYYLQLQLLLIISITSVTTIPCLEMIKMYYDRIFQALSSNTSELSVQTVLKMMQIKSCAYFAAHINKNGQGDVIHHDGHSIHWRIGRHHSGSTGNDDSCKTASSRSQVQPTFCRHTY